MGIAQNHCFAQGNKRTAYGCARLFLARNGIELRDEADEILGEAVVTLLGRHAPIGDVASFLYAQADI